MATTPFARAQKRHGAHAARTGARLAKHFGDAAHELDAAMSAAAAFDASSTGRILARGADTLDLLNRLSTNLVDPLPPGAGQSTVITTGKGRVLDWVSVLPWQDGHLIVTSPTRATAVAEWIDTFTFEEDTTLEDVSASTAMLTIAGPDAAVAVATVLGAAPGDGDGLPVAQTEFGGAPVLVWRAHAAGPPGFHVVVDAAAAGALWDAVMAAGVAPAGAVAAEALRIIHRQPAWGTEFSQNRNPLEIGLQGEISWTKGCYTGQEVVARLNTYDKVQHELAAIEMEACVDWSDGQPLIDGCFKMGDITSVSPLPLGTVRHGLAVMHRHAGRACLGGGLRNGYTIYGPNYRGSILPDEEQMRNSVNPACEKIMAGIEITWVAGVTPEELAELQAAGDREREENPQLFRNFDVENDDDADAAFSPPAVQSSTTT